MKHEDANVTTFSTFKFRQACGFDFVPRQEKQTRGAEQRFEPEVHCSLS